MLVRIKVCLFSMRAPETVNSTLDFESSQLLSSLNRLVSSYQNPSRQKRRILSTFWNSTFQINWLLHLFFDSAQAVQFRIINPVLSLSQFSFTSFREWQSSKDSWTRKSRTSATGNFTTLLTLVPSDNLQLKKSHLLCILRIKWGRFNVTLKIKLGALCFPIPPHLLDPEKWELSFHRRIPLSFSFALISCPFHS